MSKINVLAIISSVAVFALEINGTVLAADGAELYKTKTCIACHGPEGKRPALPMYPKLAGQNADYAYAQMQDIKSGARDNGHTAAMKGVMHLVTDEEMKAIAAWLTTLEQ